MSGQSHTTTDHKEIQKWAEARGGRPATVRSTGDGDEVGVIRFDFGEKDDRLEEISWDAFFEKFEESELAMLYQEQTAKGEESRFFKFVRREGADDGGGKGDRKNKGGKK